MPTDDQEWTAATLQALNNPSGNKSKYGGPSSYTDKDVEHAQEYLAEMGYDGFQFIDAVDGKNKRMNAHLLAEFCGHRTKQLHVDINSVNGYKVQVTRLKNKADSQQSQIHHLQAQVEAMKKQGITIPLPGEFVSVQTCRKMKDI